MPFHSPADRAATAETLFAQICRATPQEARNLSMLLTMSERAALALSCNARTHLRAQGRAIVGVCSLASLVKKAGKQGCRFSIRSRLEPTIGARQRTR